VQTPQDTPLGSVIRQPYKAVIGVGAGLSIGLLGWSVFGSLPSEVTANGMVVRGARMIAVEAAIAGTVITSKARVNNQVKRNEVIMSLDSKQLKIQLQGAQDQLKTALPLTRKSQQSGAQAEQKALEAAKLAQARLNSLAPQLRQKQQQLERLVQQSTTLFQQHLISNSDLINVEQSLAAVTERLQSLTDAVIAQNMQYQQIRQQNAGSRYQLQQQNIGNAANAAGYQYSINQSQLIRSPVNGELVSIGKSIGDYANPGDVLFTLMPDDGTYRAILLISSANANRVKAGNQVLISPNESPPTRFGYIKGTVINIANAPATQAELVKAFGSQETAQSFANSYGQQPGVDLPYLALVNIELNKQGLPVWTLGRQPPWGFRAGGVASARIITGNIRPIQLLIPTLRRL
jgi:HlyD family secretion protein